MKLLKLLLISISFAANVAFATDEADKNYVILTNNFDTTQETMQHGTLYGKSVTMEVQEANRNNIYVKPGQSAIIHLSPFSDNYLSLTIWSYHQTDDPIQVFPQIEGVVMIFPYNTVFPCHLLVKLTYNGPPPPGGWEYAPWASGCANMHLMSTNK